MKKLTSVTSVLFCGLLISGCAVNRQLETRVVWSDHCIANPSLTEENRSLFLGAIAVALVPKLVEGAVDSAATALKQAGERAELARSSGQVLSQPYAVSKDADLSISPEHSCLIVARGNFAPKTPSPEGKDPTGDQAVANLNNYVVIYQAKVEALKGEPYFQLVPYRLQVGTFEGSSLWSPKHRDFNIALSLTVPGSDKPFASTLITFENIPEETDAGENSWLLTGKTSAPLPLPPLPESGKKAQAKQESFIAPYILAKSVQARLAKPAPPRPDLPSNPLASPDIQSKIDTLCKDMQTYNKVNPKNPISDPQCAYATTLARGEVDKAILATQSPKALKGWADSVCTPPIDPNKSTCGDKVERPVPADARFGYMLMNASIVESRQGNKFAAFLGDALGAAKGDIAKTATQQIIPSQRQAIEDAEDATKRTAHRTVILADLTVTQSEQQLAELLAEVPPPAASDVTQARAALIKAKIAANDSYRTASLPLPYPELQ